MFFLWSILCFLATTLTPVTSTSDPVVGMCDTVCWEEGVLVDQCIVNLPCHEDSSLSRNCDAEFELCWEMAVPCRQRCRQWFYSALRRCSNFSDTSNRLCEERRRRFPDLGAPGCRRLSPDDCMLDFMMRAKARWMISSPRRDQ